MDARIFRVSCWAYLGAPNLLVDLCAIWSIFLNSILNYERILWGCQSFYISHFEANVSEDNRLVFSTLCGDLVRYFCAFGPSGKQLVNGYRSTLCNPTFSSALTLLQLELLFTYTALLHFLFIIAATWQSPTITLDHILHLFDSDVMSLVLWQECGVQARDLIITVVGGLSPC